MGAFSAAVEDGGRNRQGRAVQKEFWRLQMARVPRARRRMYYGHQSGDVTDLYEAHEMTAFLRRDSRFPN